ncbi:MAG: hypothetical protein KA354_19670 [Phycisphaerae bacterium]|nr:hypothetical protein [Phycisphaerae bacterium]
MALTFFLPAVDIFGDVVPACGACNILTSPFGSDLVHHLLVVPGAVYLFVSAYLLGFALA